MLLKPLFHREKLATIQRKAEYPAPQPLPRGEGAFTTTSRKGVLCFALNSDEKLNYDFIDFGLNLLI